MPALDPTFALRTERLRLTPLQESDAPFLVELLNDPDFLTQIGDRGVRDEESAVVWLDSGPRASWKTHGFGLLRVGLRSGGTAIGICGILRRPGLDHPDLGFALLPAWRGKGLASEAARAVLDHARHALGLTRIEAITSIGNAASGRVLTGLGFRLEGEVQVGQEPVLLYGSDGLGTDGQTPA
ncbi:MAG: GNAT family N-acetyltransferase [Gemmatimonadota bacterium]